MQTLQVICITKSPATNDHDAISHLGGVGWRYTRQQVINGIEAKTHRFYTQVGGKTAWVGVVNGRHGKYVQTHADGKWNNNLLALGRC